MHRAAAAGPSPYDPRRRGQLQASLLLIVVALAGCAGTPRKAEPPLPAADEIPQPEARQPSGSGSDVFEPGTDRAVEAEQLAMAPEPQRPAVNRQPLIDRTRDSVYGVVRSTAQTVDNIFGSADVDEKASVTRGQVAVGGRWDERDGLQERLRLKARFALPALKDRASLLIGRGDANDLVDGSGDENIDTLPNRFNDFDDEDWLVGVGYSRDGTLRRGWDFGVGVKVNTPAEPYVRATYRRNKTLGERWLWRLRPRAFWQSQRGAGVSLQNIMDYAATERWLFRWWSIAVAAEDVEGVDWTSKLIAYQNLSQRSAISYGIYASGETGFEVREKDYGLELRYRRQVSRDWLFVELLTFVNWPREFLEERREINRGFGIEFEMQFGDWPGRPHD